MVKLSELQIKELIVMDDGTRLGHIIDLEIDGRTGRIIAVIAEAKGKKNGMFAKAGELFIAWEKIVRIGEDVILVEKVKGPDLYTED
ncbi:YlmC/YmxH family sporulation protein [Oceanobacillus sp. CFH 90083]|uniref:YlmC/YmxH family sporulation protein n=1 Tax=Oceanobacillus sp. CFH 90083 TaxID=2592336 RepID=UPI00128D6738|nr:YlmC/YmxH family sporulation protein [Oceanobacillus sp. CFH 90083]